MKRVWIFLLLSLLFINIVSSNNNSDLITGEIISGEVVTGEAVTQDFRVSLQVVRSGPYLVLNSPLNQSYESGNDILLNFTVNYHDSVWYNLDYSSNTSITSQINFDMNSGSHILFLSANDSNGGLTQKNVTFFISNDSTPQESPGGGGGGGGSTCSSECASGEVRLSCGGPPINSILIEEICGNYDSDNCLEFGNQQQTICGLENSCALVYGIPQCVSCVENWQCSDWSLCLATSPQEINQNNVINLVASLTTKIQSEVIKPNSQFFVKKAAKENKNAFRILLENIKSTGDKLVDFFTKDQICTKEGEKRCHATKQNYYEECVIKSDKNLNMIWKDFKLLDGMVCYGDGESKCSEENSCDKEYDIKCTGVNDFQRCEKNSVGCLFWTKNLKCNEGETCSENLCSTQPSSDTDVCDIGEFSCINNDLYKCGNYNGKYNTYEKILECDGKICKDGTCYEDLCFNGIQDINEFGIDCGGNCLECEVSLSADFITDLNQSLSNIDTVKISFFDIDESESFIGFNVTKNFLINKGDEIAVTFNNITGNYIDLQVKIISKSNLSIKEEHSISIDKVSDTSIRVTVESEVQTQDVQLGQTVIFRFGDQQTGQTPVQIRNCVDVSQCGTQYSKPQETQSCNVISENVVCNNNVRCSWTICVNNDTESSPYDCRDINNCRTLFTVPDKVSCKDRPFIPEEEKCESDYMCKEWSECKINYNTFDILFSDSNLKYFQIRFCDDISNCNLDLNEERSCEMRIPINVKKVFYCEKEYVEIYENGTNKLVGRFNEEVINDNLKRYDIEFVISEDVQFCDFCYNGLKDFDEENVDCGGEKCPLCVPKFSYFDWLFYVITTSWIGFLGLILIFFRNKKDDKRKTLYNKFKDEIKGQKIKKKLVKKRNEDKKFDVDDKSIKIKSQKKKYNGNKIDEEGYLDLTK